MSKFLKAYIDNTPVLYLAFSLKDLASVIFLGFLLSSGIAFWRSFLFYLAFHMAYHFVRKFIKGVYNSLTSFPK